MSECECEWWSLWVSVSGGRCEVVAAGECASSLQLQSTRGGSRLNFFSLRIRREKKKTENQKKLPRFGHVFWFQNASNPNASPQ